jgi:hypothetical protein
VRPSRNPNVPIPGRTWHEGSWRTPEQIERARERARARYRRRVENDPDYLGNERERNRARYVPRGTRARPGVAKRRREGVGVLTARPTPDQLREAATLDAILELVEESIRDDARRYVYGLSLDSPFGPDDSDETWLDMLADPTHWREPGYEAA